MASSEQQTGTRDETYNLISVLYHALKGADRHEQYIADAEEAGDDELVRFFQECQAQSRDLAERAKALFAARSGQASSGRRDVVDQASMESFPASDSPAY